MDFNLGPAKDDGDISVQKRKTAVKLFQENYQATKTILTPRLTA